MEPVALSTNYYHLIEPIWFNEIIVRFGFNHMVYCQTFVGLNMFFDQHVT